MSKAADESKREVEELTGKNIAWYSAFVTAWIENRMAVDKQLLTLASVALGLLATIKPSDVPELFIWLIPVLLFVGVILGILIIFKTNCPYIELLLKNDDSLRTQLAQHEKKLQIWTTSCFIMFFGGVVMTLLLLVLQSGFYIAKVKGV